MKPGYRTTEFWALVTMFLGAGVSAICDQVPAEYATAAVALSAACYAISRGLAKRSSGAPGTAVAPTPPSPPAP